uniref:Uncharacterized protein n=1 Tax=Pseudomonas aeruginosa TaxID=287 RepID=A0A3G1DGQ3_PSEAI|nr:hypothetical protein [Pseudomonas aeruginosa]AMP35834.1 Hypothetical protein [Pseudomonas aeruginosa]
MDVIASNAADTQEMAMTEILATGEERKRPYSSPDMAFQFNDVEIRNPYFSPCGTAVVDPVLAYGFDVFHTGGGCMALRKEFCNGNYLLLSNEINIAEPEDWDECTLGLYDADGDQKAFCELRDVPYAQFGLPEHEESLDDPVRLLCPCCGARTTGRQWRNQDVGHGLCSTCIESVRAKMAADEFIKCYGHQGIHFGLSQSAPSPQLLDELAQKKLLAQDSPDQPALDSNALKDRYRSWAQDNLANDDLQVNDGAQVTLCDDGAFVETWTWVPRDSLPEAAAPGGETH